jgi:hypothetical protein
VNRQVKQRQNIVNLLLKRPAIRKTRGWSFTIANAKGISRHILRFFLLILV